MTQQALRRAMQSQRDAAVGTDNHVTAVVALEEGRVAPAIEEQDALLATQKSCSEC
jgi:hypothetical protein